jgi:hypothetical protein
VSEASVKFVFINVSRSSKVLALQKLESQVDDLSQLIKEKLLGKEAVL